MDKKIIGSLIVGAIVFGGSGFYGGITYSASMRGARNAQGTSFTRGFGTRGNGAGLVAGQVIAKDDTSLTIKLNAGGSKIVLVATSTPVMKSVDGSLSDVAIGETVVANGTVNSDGSITAEAIQIRPAGSNVFIGGGNQTGVSGSSGATSQNNAGY